MGLFSITRLPSFQNSSSKFNYEKNTFMCLNNRDDKMHLTSESVWFGWLNQSAMAIQPVK